MLSYAWWLDFKQKASSLNHDKFENILITIYTENSIQGEIPLTIKFKPREYIRIEGPLWE